MSTSRREFLALAATALAVREGHAANAPSGTLSVVALRVDGLEKPLGLESARPRLSWQLASAKRAVAQRSYRILVASDPGLLEPGAADIWDSGIKYGSKSFDVAYAGPKPKSRQRLWWRVEVEDEWGDRGLSSNSWWEMGLLQSTDWQAQWIAAETPMRRADRDVGLRWIWAAHPTTEGATQHFRFAFQAPNKPSSATLFIVARDSLDGVWLNGVAATRQRFAPGVVNNSRMESIALPVASGPNLLSVQASHAPKAWPATPAGAMAALLRLEYDDGTTERYATGPEWMTSTEPEEGWQRSGTAIGWASAVPATSKPAFDPWSSEPAMHCRRSFVIDAEVRKARLYVTALGAYAVRLNAEDVGNALLAPESTDFTKRVLYRTFDVTDLMKKGDNALGITVGDGWYGSTGLFGGRFAFGDAPNRLLAQLEIELPDGRRQVVGTSPDWHLAPSAILSSEIYDGEVYDARTEKSGWDTPAYRDIGWFPAMVISTTRPHLVSHVSPPVRVFATLLPKSISKIGAAFVVDFGQNFSGWCLLKAKAPAGTTVTLRFAEVLHGDGTIDTSNLRSALARDIYVFRGDEREEHFRPHFTYHGFRYVEISGWPGELPDNFVVGEALSSDLPITGDLRIEDPTITRIARNAYWSQRSNFVGLPTDCPQRDERLGWMGDAQVFWNAAGFNMDVQAFTRRFMGDVRDAQDSKGAFSEFNPQSADAQMMKGAPGWADAGILLPWETWWRYGDTGIIDDNWDAMFRYSAHVLAENPDHIWRNSRGSDYGDWLALDATQPGDPTTPKDLVATAIWASVTQKLMAMATATGRVAEASQLGTRHQQIVAAFRRTFIAKDGVVGNGSQTGYVLALRYGLVPTQLRHQTSRALAADIRRRGTVLSTGFIGTPHALDVLADAGDVSLVYDLLDRKSYPSWGYMVEKGATTMWERWNSDTGDVAMNSYNHYAFGAVVGFFYRRIAGLEALKPAFQRVQIRPLANGQLKAAGATYESRSGRFRTDWHQDPDGSLGLELSIPANCSAELHIPSRGSGAFLEDGHPLQHSKGVRVIARTRSNIVLDVRSGDYSFRAL